MPGISWLLNNSRSSEGVGAHLENQKVLFGSFKSKLNQDFVALFLLTEKYTKPKEHVQSNVSQCVSGGAVFII